MTIMPSLLNNNEVEEEKKAEDYAICINNSDEETGIYIPELMVSSELCIVNNLTPMVKQHILTTIT